MYKIRLTTTLVLIVVFASCQNQNSMESRNKAIVKRYVEELVNNTTGDYSKAYEMISPEFTLYFGGFGVLGMRPSLVLAIGPM